MRKHKPVVNQARQAYLARKTSNFKQGSSTLKGKTSGSRSQSYSSNGSGSSFCDIATAIYIASSIFD